MKEKHLPGWTWFVPFFILLAGTLLSLSFKSTNGVYWIYFPVNLGVVMALWWGPRVLAAVFVNALIAVTLFNLPNKALYPIYALPETLEVLFSWILVRERFKDSRGWKPSPKNISLYFVYGLFIPSIICSIAIQGIFTLSGFQDRSLFFWNALTTSVGDLLGAVFISIPALILVSPWLSHRHLSLFPFKSLPPLHWDRLVKREKVTFAIILSSMFILAVATDLPKIWYIYGIVMLASAAWYGLYAALSVNTFVVFLTVILPKVLNLPWSSTLTEIQNPATLLTLCFCSVITGSAVTTLTGKIHELSETEGQLKAAKEQAEEASRAKSEFLARMSHEIRTPLNSVLGMLELLRETQLSKDQERYLTLFSHAGENLKALINDLLDFSKIEAKALTVEDVSYNVHSTVRNVFEILQIKAEEKGLHFELFLSKEVPPLQWGDPTRLRQVLFNLIGNALKFTNEGSVTVKVDLTKDSTEKLLIEVQDTGIGIPRDKQSKLFSPFFQGDPTITRKYGGTGLGLVISKNLVEIMGGSMEMKSLAGRGTTFRITLPHRPDFSSNIEKQNKPSQVWTQTKTGQRFRILLVDDSEDNRVLMIHYLKSLPFDCDEAVNGQEAVDKFKEKKYDLVFMDMQMPIMTGYKATEMIRHYEAEKKLPHTPIIALTATAVVEDLQRALTSGCDSYAVKPVKKAEILDILAHNLTTKSPNKEAFKEPPSPSI
ncbi:ATP-binding protein [Bdellovibrio sp.]|uniref:ATP-binding protein n=1 Tax=Bdellovibrio sp. TaxID=28201 RepID=UPI003221432C